MSTKEDEIGNIEPNRIPLLKWGNDEEKHDSINSLYEMLEKRYRSVIK